MFSTPSLNDGALSLTLLLVTIAAYGFARLRIHRQRIIRLKKAGLDMPPHGFLLGHLLQAAAATDALPPGIMTDYAVGNMAKSFPDGVFYLDTWPVSPPILVITTPTAANALQKYSPALDKPEDIKGPLNKYCAGPTLMTLDEKSWKTWRAIFNPSFSTSYLLQLAPNIAREIAIFQGILSKKMEDGYVFGLEPLTSRLAVDIMGKVSFNMRLGHQEKDNALALLIKSQGEWTAFGDMSKPWKQLNPFRSFVLWNNCRLMKKYIGKELDERFAKAKSTQEPDGREKSLISLAISKYIATSGKGGESPAALDTEFKSMLTSQILIFMLAGHETASTAMCMCYYNLFTNLNTLARVRAEYDEVFGPDTSLPHIINLLEQTPERLNQLHYTLAVVKETLRLAPPVSGVRQGTSSLSLSDDSGKLFPTEDFKIWTNHTALHRNPKYWKEPDKFIPERWLAKEGDSLYPVKGAWRPFELGSRNCIGQALAIMEIKLVMLMTIRQFDIEPSYEDHDPEVWGSKAWLTFGKSVGGKPYKDLPVRVRLAKRE